MLCPTASTTPPAFLPHRGLPCSISPRPGHSPSLSRTPAPNCSWRRDSPSRAPTNKPHHGLSHPECPPCQRHPQHIRGSSSIAARWHWLGCPHMCHRGTWGGHGTQVVNKGLFSLGGRAWLGRAGGQVGVWRKTHECKGFSSDIWWLFDPREGQLSGPGGWRKARGWDLGTAVSLGGGQT